MRVYAPWMADFIKLFFQWAGLEDWVWVISMYGNWPEDSILYLLMKTVKLWEGKATTPTNTWMKILLCHRLIVQFSSVAQSCPTLCDPVNLSMPDLPVHHQLPESTQTHVHWVNDTIQPSHPLSSPSPPALNLSQRQGLFKWVSSSQQVAKVLIGPFLNNI